jgi:ABC-type spermidine/putrescine transport system permease subunit II
MHTITVSTLPVTMWDGLRYELSPATAAASGFMLLAVGAGFALLAFGRMVVGRRKHQRT